MAEGMRRLPHAFRTPLFGLLMAVSISGTLSAIFTFYALGLSADIIPIWLQNWAVAFCIAVPVALIVRPLALAVATMITQDA